MAEVSKELDTETRVSLSDEDVAVAAGKDIKGWLFLG